MTNLSILLNRYNKTLNKQLLFALYILIVVCIGFATIIEKYHGTTFVSEQIYGAWWFTALWAVLTVTACAYMLKQQLYKRMAVFLLHLSFVVILAGALTTHLFAKRGTVRLRTGFAENIYIDKDHRVEQFPFTLTLKEFRIVNYPGTDAPLDYQSVIQSDHGEVIVSMNNIGRLDGYRLFQQSYDTDGGGVTLGVSYDPWGIGITYIGYLLLLVGIIATLLSRKTQMRSLYQKAVKTKTLLLLFYLFSFVPSAAQANETLPVVDKDIAHRLGTVSVLYNNRICPLNTVATDFVTKLSGNASWNGYSADEIFVSWMIYYSPWEQQKIIRVKSRDVQQLLGISGQWASYSDFIDEYHEYKLKDAALGHLPAEKKALMDADEKFHIIEMFYKGQFVRIFPYRIDKTINWYMPGAQSMPREIPVKEQFFIKQAMDFLTESIVTGQKERAFEIIAKIKLFQWDMIGDLLPTDRTMKAELFYNTLRCQKWPVFLALTISILLCVFMLLSVCGRWLQTASLTFIILLEGYVTLQLALRWWLSGHIPVSNGPETMLFMAWVVLLLTLFLRKSMGIITAFGPLISSFCLLVATLGGSSSQITPLMPVLQSPLLSVHVMTVMCAYALFALQLLLGIYALLLNRKHHDQIDKLDRATALSQLLLYPAVFLLTIGIFLGAVWANVSWGNYWSWDPKETWALITLMIYAVPFHSTSIPMFKKPVVYHVYMIGAFLSVVITYFGVNYLLGGMHSYA